MLIALELAQELGARFSLAELRRERDVADANTHPDLEDYPYWVWYHRAVEEAIDLKRMAAPTTTRKRGRIDIGAVRARADIVALAESYGLKLQRAGRNFRALCPFHQERSPSFYLYSEQNRCHCFGCQADGDAITFVMKMDGVDFITAAEKVGGI